MNKINTSIEAIIRPIVHDMTQVKIAQQTNPLVSRNNESEAVKELKKKCVHIIFDGKEYRQDIHRNNKGEAYCATCGRQINTVFSDEEIQCLNKCIKILDGIIVFGIPKGLAAGPLQTLIQVKSTLPAIIQIFTELKTFISEEDKASNNMINIGSEYADPSFGRITRM